MRSGGTTLDAYLDNPTITEIGGIWNLISITPTSGSVVRWSDHPDGFIFEGYVYYGGGSLTHPIVTVGDVEDAIGLEVAALDIQLECGEGATFNGARLTAAAEAGVLDGASVVVHQMYVLADETILGTMWVFSGKIDEAQPTSYGVKLTVESAAGELSINLPRTTYQPGCTNQLFDPICGLSKATNTETLTAAAGATTSTVQATTAKGNGWYVGGVLTITSGALSGTQRTIAGFTAGTPATFTVDRPWPSAPATGVTFTAYPGCDLLKTTCVSKFNNLPQFRGFDLVPRNEASSHE